MKQALYTFNRGRVSQLAMARVDQKRVAMSADIMTNWIPRVLGPMSLRPGLQYITSTLNNATARYLKFIFSVADTALVELTNGAMRVIVNDAPVTRASVSSAVTNGNFDTDVTGWTDSDEAGGTSAWQTGGYLGLTGNGTAAAIRDQTVTVSAGDQGVEHALRIVIERGPVTLRVGSTSGGDEYIRETALETGTHSLSFTPTGDFYIRLMSRLKRIVLVDSCNVEAAGVMQVPTPWDESDLDLVRYDQSGDVLFVACAGKQQRRIERRSTTSWSVVRYAPVDGPLEIENTSPTTLTASAISGNITLTASASLFRSTDVGTLGSITSVGQTVTKSITTENDFTNAIRVTGVGTTRTFTIVLSGTWVATVTLQRSLDSSTGPWEDVAGKTWTANTTTTFADGLDNQIAWYRIGVKTGAFTSGQVDARLTINTGSITGMVRVTGYTSPTSVSAEVIVDLGGTTATEFWSEGSWSDKRGWPSSVRFHEGRLWWAGKDKIWGSISDAYDGFDPYYEGDAGPIARSIGSGPVDTINWMLSLQRLVLGGEGAEFSARASSLDEPLTPTNFGMRPASTQGSAAVSAEQIDQRGVYVQRGGFKVYELGFDSNSYDYASTDLTMLIPEIGSPGISRMAVQRQPDTRIHCVRTDGTVAIGVFDKTEDVLAWVDIETDGEFEDVVVLPGTSGDDNVYLSVKRVINGSTVRYLEKCAKETECRGGALNKQADSFIAYTGVATTSITGLSHLEGESVCVWANGADIGTASDYTQTYTVSGGAITLPSAYTNVVVGLPYTAQWKSAQIAESVKGVSLVESLVSDKKLDHIGFMMAWVHPKGLRYGPDFDTLDDLPEVESGIAINQNTIRDTYTEQSFEFPGQWVTDARICLQAQAPRPCTVLAAIPNMNMSR